MNPYGGPEPLRVSHDVERFDCGAEALDDWLRRRASRNSQAAGFYRHWGFEASPIDDLTLMLLIKDIRPT